HRRRFHRTGAREQLLQFTLADFVRQVADIQLPTHDTHSSVATVPIAVIGVGWMSPRRQAELQKERVTKARRTRAVSRSASGKCAAGRLRAAVYAGGRMELIGDLTLVLTAALVGGVAAHRAGQPLIVGYIVAGVVVGPFTGGVTVRHVEGIEQLAELGVALLLFSLGLEVSFRELAPVRAVALAGGTLQTVVTIAFGAALAGALGWAWRPGLWFGALIALSSTMIAL